MAKRNFQHKRLIFIPTIQLSYNRLNLCCISHVLCNCRVIYQSTQTCSTTDEIVSPLFCVVKRAGKLAGSEKRSLLAKSITDASLRIHELPDFHFYAIADGIKMLLSRCGRWSGFGKDDVDDEPDLFKFSIATVDSRQSKGASIFASRINSHDFFKNSFSTYWSSGKSRFTLCL